MMVMMVVVMMAASSVGRRRSRGQGAHSPNDEQQDASESSHDVLLAKL